MYSRQLQGCSVLLPQAEQGLPWPDTIRNHGMSVLLVLRHDFSEVKTRQGIPPGHLYLGCGRLVLSTLHRTGPLPPLLSVFLIQQPRINSMAGDARSMPSLLLALRTPDTLKHLLPSSSFLYPRMPAYHLNCHMVGLVPASERLG